MATTIDMPIGLDDLDKIFAVTDLLDNKDQLIREFKPEVLKILVNKQFFKGHFRIKYEEMFDEFITSLIRKQVIKHWPEWSPEDILILTDTNWLKMIASPYFDQENYTKEGTNESTHSLS